MSDTCDCVVRLTERVLPGQSEVTLEIPRIGTFKLRRTGDAPRLEAKVRRLPVKRVQELRAVGYAVEVDGADPDLLARQDQYSGYVDSATAPAARGRRTRRA